MIKLHKHIRSWILRAISTFDMVQDSDKIILWISWWKDSMLLAKMMCDLRDRSHLNFELTWAYIYSSNLMRCNVDFSKQEEFFKKIWLNVEYIEIKLPKWAKLAEWIWISCQWCSYARRITFFKLCKKWWYNKIALWHHMDDWITTLFMNMINNKKRALMPPINKMKNWDSTIIRPMSFIRERDIVQLVQEYSIPVSPCTCPIWEKSRRKQIWELMQIIEEKEQNSIENIYHASIKKFIQDYKHKDYITD